MTLLRTAVFYIFIFTLAGCNNDSLPTIGRTHGDFPMKSLLNYDDNEKCYRFSQNVLFEAPFAHGMAYLKNRCLEADKKLAERPLRKSLRYTFH